MQKTILITGSAKGLGKAIAQHFAQQQYNIILHYHKSHYETMQLAEELLPLTNVLPVCANLNEYAEVENMFAEIKTIFGNIDVLINNVGNFLRKNILEIEISDWHEIIQNNLNSVFYTSQNAILLMKNMPFGRIINIGFAGITNTQAEHLFTPYFIAKQGVLTYSKSLAKALALDNQPITVNVVSPGVLENSLEKPLDEIPKGRLATFEEFIRVIDFLVSEKSDYLTGQHIEVAGGWRL